jgi:hypothetical protein
MTTMLYTGDDAILRRAQSQIVMLKDNATPITVPSLVAALCLIGIICACISEYYAAGLAFHSAFPVKSDGASLAGELSSLRLPIIVCLLVTTAILHAVPNRAKMVLDWAFHVLGAWGIIILLAAVGVFMLSASLLTLGDGTSLGLSGQFIGLALGVASSLMFGLSYLSAHAMFGKLFVAVPTIVQGLAQRQNIRAGEKLIGAVEAKRATRESIRNDITELEKPDAMARITANEAGAITGKYQAIIHDLVASRKAMGDAEVGPDDVAPPSSTVPLGSLEQRQSDLAHYTVQHFFDLILNSTKG